MSITPLTSQLPSLGGMLPDLFRRNDGTTVRGDDTSTAQSAGDTMTAGGEDQRALAARTSDDTARLLARRAALGPLTYGRRMMPVDAPPAAPIGMRGAHLDVRG